MFGLQRGTLEDWDYTLVYGESVQDSDSSREEAVLESGDICCQAFVLSGNDCGVNYP